MKYLAIADTDIGILKDTNQDSVLVKHGQINGEEIIMAIVCDGMGGLAKGELASATVIRYFSDWFDNELEKRLTDFNIYEIGNEWVDILKNLNMEISEYGRSIRSRLGTTFTGLLLINGLLLSVHVGDSRLYKIDSDIKQITTDQTFVAREISRGNMTVEQAKVDKRRNVLLQCVGASDVVEPEVITDCEESGIYMLCSDGFRHEITEDEMLEYLSPSQLTGKDKMRENARRLIETVKSRNERDNISVVLVKSE